MTQAEFNEAFLAAQQEMPTIAKNRTATIPTSSGSYSYSYADLGDVLSAALPVLHAHGLALAQAPVSSENQVGVATRLLHKSGHVEEFGTMLMSAGRTPQDAGSAMTYARRYAACAVLGVVADEDVDGVQTGPVREDATPAGEEWLRTAVGMFKQWDDDQRVAVAKATVSELGVGKPMTLEEAKQVRARMAETYYQEHPDDEGAPF